MSDYKDPENTLVMETTKGQVVIECLPEASTKTRRASQGTCARRLL